MTWTGEITREQARQFMADAETAKTLARVTGVPLADVVAHLGLGSGGAGQRPKKVEASSAATGDGASTGSPSSAAEQFEASYAALLAAEGFEPPADAERLVTLSDAEAAELEAWAQWSPRRVYASYFGEEPKTPDEEPAYASDEDAMYAQLTGGNR
jgi:hypothetical protein